MITVLISLSAVHAASTVYVNTTGLDSNPGTIEAPYLTINKGVQSVDENGNINIADGFYSGENNTNITIDKNMTIVGQSQTGTIINGSDTNWIFRVNSGVVLNLLNLTLTNGNATLGGAILNNGTLNVNDCTFTNNQAYWGGAILSLCSEPVNIITNVTNCTFIGNQAESGGAIASVVFYSGVVNCTVNTCNFINNNATNSGGSLFVGLLGNSASILTLINSNFTLNHAPNGGAAMVMGNCTVTGCNFSNNTGNNYGAFNYFSNSPFDDNFCNVFDCNFTNNTVTEVPSGALSNYIIGGAIGNVHAKLNLSNCNFTDNSITGTNTYGGAVCNAEGTLTALDCTFTNNSASYGGAIGNIGGSTSYPATSSITRCSFTNNTATYGGAIANYLFLPIFGQGSGLISSTVSFCNFTNNSATQEGGAIYNTAGFSTTGSANININNSNFNTNNATYGGAIMTSCFVSAGSVKCNINSSNFDSNTANGGGALYNYSNSGLAVCNILSSNFVHNNAVFGGALVNNVFNGTMNVTFCRIFGNSGLGAAINNGGIIDANYNWWSSNNPDFFYLLVGMSYPTNWLYMTINATPSTINNTQTSLITVSFNNYSTDGSTYTPLDPSIGHIPDGTPITFSLIEGLLGTYGLLTPPLDMETTDGLASIVFTATRAGIQQINATTDNQNVTTTVTINPASYVSIIKEFRDLPWGEVITTAYYNDKIYAIVKVHNHGPDGTSVSVLDLLNGLTWTGNYYVVHAVGSYPITNDSWILNDPTCPFNGTHWNINNLPTFIGSVKWLAIEGIIQQIGTVSNYAETVSQSSYPYQGYDDFTAYLTAEITPTIITVDNARGNKDDTVTLQAVLTDYLGNPLNGQTVEFWIDNIKVGENTTDSTGKALFNYKISQTPGNHSLNATFLETTLYHGCNATGQLYVPTADLYIQITSNKNNPTVGESFTITYKLGNNGPDDAENVTITIPIPEGFQISSITGDGTWNIVGNNIIWTFNNVTVGDPYLYITGWTTKAGNYIFTASINSNTFNLNSRGVNSLSINAEPQVNAASTNTIGMQQTGAPITGIVLAILMVLGGFVGTRKKQ